MAGKVENVGGGRDPKVIRPEHPAKPSNPAASKGDAGNIKGSEKPLIRHQPPK
jgi:hypothetical protein